MTCPHCHRFAPAALAALARALRANLQMHPIGIDRTVQVDGLSIGLTRLTGGWRAGAFGGGTHAAAAGVCAGSALTALIDLLDRLAAARGADPDPPARRCG